MNTTTEPTIQDMLDTLNGYTGEDIWNDVIYRRWERLINWRATHQECSHGYDVFITKSGTYIHYSESDDAWEAI